MIRATTLEGARSVATETAREAYERGLSPRRVKHRYHMSDGELQDMAPEEAQDVIETPEGDCGY